MRLLGPPVLVVLLVTVAVAGCDDRVGTAPLPTTPLLPSLKAPIASFRIDGEPPTVGTSSQFRATATFTNGFTADVTSEASWRSSRPPIATVSPTGAVSGISLGTMELTSDFQGFSERRRMMISGPGTYFMFLSDPGDIVGIGGAREAFRVSVSQTGPGRIRLRQFEVEPVVEFMLDLRAPGGQPLAPGTYENATGLDVPAQPGIQFEVNNRRCPDIERVSGRFTIHQLAFGPSGEVQRIHVTFEHSCAGATAGTRGDVAVNR